MRKQKLTFEDHVRLGAELAAMRDRLVDIDLKLNNAYPFASKQALAAHRSYAKIDKM